MSDVSQALVHGPLHGVQTRSDEALDGLHERSEGVTDTSAKPSEPQNEESSTKEEAQGGTKRDDAPQTVSSKAQRQQWRQQWRLRCDNCIKGHAECGRIPLVRSCGRVVQGG